MKAASPWHSIQIWIKRGFLALMLLLLMLTGLGAALLGTAPGLSMTQSLINRFASSDQQIIQMDGLDQLWGGVQIRSLTMADKEGVWLEAKDFDLSYSLSDLLSLRLRSEHLTLSQLIIHRSPHSAEQEPPPAPDAPLVPALPALRADFNKITIDHIQLGEALLGKRAQLTLAGTLVLDDKPMHMHGTLSLQHQDVANGFVRAQWDFLPTEGKRHIAIEMHEPRGGLVARLLDMANLPSLSLSIKGDGPAHDWRSTLSVAMDGVNRVSGSLTAQLSRQSKRIQAYDVFSDLDGDDEPAVHLTPKEIATQALSVTQSISKRKSNTYRQGGMFLQSLFGKRIIGDQLLTRPLDRVLRRRGAMSKIIFNGSIVAAIVISVWLGISYLGNRSMAMQGARLRADVVKVFTSESVSNEQAIIGLANLLPILKQIHGFEMHGVPWHLRGLYNGSLTLSDTLMTEYFSKVRALILRHTVAALAKNLEERRQQDGKTLTEYDELYDHYRVYLTLTGQSQDYLKTVEDHERNEYIVNRILDSNKYWFVGVDQEKGLDEQSLLGAAMRAHFEFFMSQIDKPQLWSSEADIAMVERINFELSEALWVQQSYRDIISNASGMYEPVKPEMLVSGQNAELLSFPFTFSSVFTQEVWNDYVQEAIQAKADILVSKFKSLGIEKSAEQVSDRLSRQFVNDYRRQWWRLSSQVRPIEFTDLNDAIEKMGDLTGDESPYVSLINSLKQRRELKTNGGIEPGLLFSSDEAEKEPWLEEGLNAIYAAQESLASFAKKTQVGKRTEDIEALKEVAGSINDAYTSLYDALKAIPDQSKQQLMKLVLSRILDNARIALSDAIGNEVNTQWRQAVSEIWKLEMQDRFPFNKDAAYSVSLRRFAELFNPSTGVISKQLEIIKGIRDIEINGKSVVYESREFKRIKRNVALLQRTLFVDNSETLNAPVNIRFNQRSGISAMSFELGDQLVSLFDKQLPRYELQWKQDEEAKARFTVHILKGIERKSWYEEAVDDPWCLIRVLRSGQQMGYNEHGGLILQWPFQAMAAGRKLDYVAELAVEGDGWDELLSLDFWLDIQLPDQVTR